jgi:hypothetical protein
MFRLLALILLSGSAACAQSSNGYAFFAPGGVTCCGHTAMTLHAGFGGEAVLGHGIGLGAEIGALGTRQDFADSVAGAFSPNGYYHFVHRRRAKVDPFVTAGYTVLFRSGHLNFFNFGGGFNYWGNGRLGLRLEVRDHVHSEWASQWFEGPTLHYWGVRVGLAFR